MVRHGGILLDRSEWEYLHARDGALPGTPVSRAYGELAAAGSAQSVVEIVVTPPPAGGSLAELESRAAKLPRVRNTLSEQEILQGVNEATHGIADSLLSVAAVRAGEIVGDIGRHRASHGPWQRRAAGDPACG